MKKLIIIFISLGLFIFQSNAQLKVSSAGNVGLQVGSNTPLSPLSIGGVGGNSQVYIGNSSYNTTLKVEKTSPSGSGISFYGIDASVFPSYNTPSFNFGIKGQSYSSGIMGAARTYGVLGVAGNGCSGYNYGIFGQLSGTSNGSAVVGMVTNSLYPEVQIPGQYAGYFVGTVMTTLIYSNGFILNSDKRYKEHIVTIDQPKSLQGIMNLNPVEYNLKQIYMKGRKDSAEVDVPYFDEKSQLFTKKHYGLIAQEIQAIYPDLVYEKEDGYLAVDYTGLIPILIQSVKELKTEIESLKTKNNNAPAKVGALQTGLNEADALTYPVLDQNTPNPFNQSTTIGYYLPTSINTAAIYVYDMNGVQLKSYNISERGKKNIIINGSEFNAGMYLYALIADGKIIDTKRMILTK
ncbi:MAG: tail fiber domain-containing protein [Bacteroidales bacterium]